MVNNDKSQYLIPLMGLNLDELKEVATDNGLPAFQGAQIAKWIYEKRVSTIEEMTNLSKEARNRLTSKYCVGCTSADTQSSSADGTIKYLFSSSDGNAVESVYIPEDDRATLCISSQKGCKMNCLFCMTGKQGFHGNLSANEILNQIVSVPQSQSLTNVVFMGMGEPMDNYDAVMKTIEILTAKWGFGWSPKRITVSSIGKLDNLKRLIEKSSVHIAISVHSPYHTERLSLMPVENAYPIADVVELLKNYDFAHQRRLSVEYIMWNNLNDDLEHAEALAKLLRRTGARVNLIKFHSIPGVKLMPSTPEKMIQFREFLNSRGLICTIRRSRGEDIMAACGMLAGKSKH
ncbi:MAG: 23S rRNA (adenine(2503)-C(2))-methyltransferase RlmN [Muribaculaceae bacterium]|nr:23S rRNA (adenine(2503)-C(2))-methyltransferase RlmN [Muribaculaceae bacterium]